VRISNPNVRRASGGSQACVSFRDRPWFTTDGAATWVFDRRDLDKILKNWNREVSWGQFSIGEKDPGATTRMRRAPAKPIQLYLRRTRAPKNGTCRVLYHGVGADEPGLKAIARGRCRGVGYDKYPKKRSHGRKPTGKFNEIFSIFTLNTVTERQARQILRDIRSHLKAGGRAVVATRRGRPVCEGLLPRSYAARPVYRDR